MAANMAANMAASATEAAFRAVAVAGRRYRVADLAAPAGARRGAPLLSCEAKLRDPGQRSAAPLGAPLRADSPPRAEALPDPDAEELPLERDAASGEMVLRREIPRAFYPFIIGKDGETQKRLERETQCRVAVPRRGAHSQVVEFRGPSCDAVSAAFLRVRALCERHADDLPPTHFVCAPLNTPELAARMRAFRDAALREAAAAGAAGMDESLFMPPSRPHLTLFVLRLTDAQQLQSARELLQKLAPRVYDAIGSQRRALSAARARLSRARAGTTSLVVALQGLGFFGPRAEAAEVVFAKVAPGAGLDRLRRAAELLAREFSAAGLLSARDRAFAPDGSVDIKFHATLLNVKYRKGDRRRRPAPLDASALLAKLGGFDFGEVRVPSLALCAMAPAQDDGGFYAVEERAVLP